MLFACECCELRCCCHAIVAEVVGDCAGLLLAAAVFLVNCDIRVMLLDC